MRRSALQLLTALALIWVPAMVLAWVRPSAAGDWWEPAMLLSLLAALLLVIWAVSILVGEREMPPAARRRWALMLVLGGPITAAVFLWRRAD